MSASRWRRWRRWTWRQRRRRSALIQVDYEELPTVAGIDAAIKTDAPLIHEEKGGNIGTHERSDRGDADEGFAQSDEIVEDTFTFPMVYHYAMEPHSVIAHYDER